MSCSYQINEEIVIHVCPVDGISIQVENYYGEAAMNKKECLRLANALIHFYKTNYVAQDEGVAIVPLTEQEIHDVVNDELREYPDIIKIT